MVKFNKNKEKGEDMGKILLNSANITCNNDKDSNLKAFVDGKIVNTLNYKSKEVIMEYADTDFIFLINENMEISDENADISLLREVRRYAKNYKQSNYDTKANDFVETLSSTLTYMKALEDTGEVPPASREIASTLISYDKALIATTDRDCVMYVSGGNLVNIFEEESSDHLSSVQIPKLKTNDLIILLSATVAKSISQATILDRLNAYDSAESVAQNIANLYTANYNEDFSISVILVKLIQDKSKTFMRSELDSQQIQAEHMAESVHHTGPVQRTQFEEPVRKDNFWSQSSEDSFFAEKRKKAESSSSFDSIKMSKNEKIKRRTSIYIKRAVSIILVLALMAGIIWGMVSLLKIIFKREGPGESETPIPSPSPIVVVSPSPTVQPSPSLEPEPSETSLPDPEDQYILHKISVTTDHSTLNAIAAYYNETYKLNYPDAAMLVQKIAGLNGIEDVNIIFYGQEIKIPITPIP